MIIIPWKKAANEEAIFDKTTYSCTFSKMIRNQSTKIIVPPLRKQKRYLVNLKTKRNASKFAMFMEKENPCSFFHF